MAQNASGKGPVFIGGLYKSGTSLLRAMLSRHSNIAGGLETFWFDLDFSREPLISRDIRNWDATRKEPLEQHLTRLADFFEMDRKTVSAMAQGSSGPEEFLDSFMSAYAAGQGKKRWVEKTPANVLHIERIFAFWPRAFFIHVVRDPRDVYSSNALKSEEWGRPALFAKLWVRFISAYEKAARSGLSGSMLEVRYEDLVLHPARTMRGVLDFVSEPWEEGVSGFSGEPRDLEKVQRITGKTSTTLERLSRPLARDRVGVWKNEIQDEHSLQELELLIKQHGLEKAWNAYKYAG